MSIRGTIRNGQRIQPVSLGSVQSAAVRVTKEIPASEWQKATRQSPQIEFVR